MAAGKIRKALAADRALIEQHPDQALQHVQIAYALLKAGMGDRARTEALRATQLEPKSAIAFKALGWICQFDAIGIQYSQGFDWDCATTAYKKALELDPDDSNNLINLGVLDEYDHNGDRYSPYAPIASPASMPARPHCRSARSAAEGNDSSKPLRTELLGLVCFGLHLRAIRYHRRGYRSLSES